LVARGSREREKGRGTREGRERKGAEKKRKEGQRRQRRKRRVSKGAPGSSLLTLESG